jgi:hypothetical protein
MNFLFWVFFEVIFENFVFAHTEFALKITVPVEQKKPHCRTVKLYFTGELRRSKPVAQKNKIMIM